MNIKKFKFNQIIIIAVTCMFVGIMIFNIFIMYNIASKQTEEIGKMRIQNISIGFQKSLTKAENTLNQISSGINELISQNASEEETLS